MPNTTTLNETLRSPIDGTEYVRLATPGANWKAQLSSIAPTIATSNVTYYVSTTGSDSNDGLSAITPWATLRHAINVINNIDWSGGFVPTVQFAAGTYTATNQGFNPASFSYGTLSISPLRGHLGASIFLVGDNTTPSNVVFDMTTSTWQFALLSNAQINPRGIHFKCDNLIFATQSANANLQLVGFGGVGGQTALEIETVAGSSGFVPVLFGTVRPGGSLQTVDVAGATLFSSFCGITISGTSNAGDFQAFASAVGGGSTLDFGLCNFDITTTLTVGLAFLYLVQYASGFFVPLILTGNANISGPGALLLNSSSFNTIGPPTSFPTGHTIQPASIDHSSSWKSGNSTQPYTQILFPTHAGGLPDTTDLFDTGWGIFDAGVNGIWLAANKGGTIFKVQLV